MVNRVLFVVVALLIARFVPVFGAYSPVLGVVIFAGTILSRHRFLAFVIPFATLFVADYFQDFYDGMTFNYLAYAALIGMGFWLQSKSAIAALASSFFGSVIFFILSNLGVWLYAGIYPVTANGLRDCFVMGSLFYKFYAVGTVVSVGLLYSGYAQLRRWGLVQQSV